VIAEAGNGEQGVALAEEHDPDLILLDLNMPGINGLEDAGSPAPDRPFRTHRGV